MVLFLVYAGLIAAFIAFITNWLALIPWRRAKDKHWSERARVFHPVRIAAVSNLWVIPAVFTFAAVMVWSDTSPPWASVLLVAALGTFVGTLPLDREVFPRIVMRDLLRQAALGSMIRLLSLFLFLGGAALMPDQFDYRVLIIALVVITLWAVWARVGWTNLGRFFHLLQPPPERLRNIVADTATKMNVRVREVWLLRVSLAQAFAMPDTRTLLFTERLVQLLPDDELAAICAHELGHLTESRADRYQRSIQLFVFFPWLFFKPVVHTYGLLGFCGLLASSLAVPWLYRKISRKLEVRADQIAKVHELEAGTYARALLRLHEDALLPAVLAKEQETHPHLYDRLMNAGFTPDFPRPAPAHSMAWHGIVFSAALGALLMFFVMRLTHMF